MDGVQTALDRSARGHRSRDCPRRSARDDRGHAECIHAAARFHVFQFRDNGHWEDFIVRELVPYIDAHYRTLADPASRGLAGHSMGGYGAARIGMKHPDVFSCMYLLSPWGLIPNFEGAVPAQAAAVKTLVDFDKADFAVRLHLAAAAAWSPRS